VRESEQERGEETPKGALIFLKELPFSVCSLPPHAPLAIYRGTEGVELHG
jgi:hypothetical protein